jgi:hypothetical protein
MKTKLSFARTVVACAALALGALLWTPPALAAPASNPPSTRPHEPEVIIKGIIYKPRVFIFIGKPKLNLDWSVDDPRFKRSFLERTLNSVWSRPL